MGALTDAAAKAGILPPKGRIPQQKRDVPLMKKKEQPPDLKSLTFQDIPIYSTMEGGWKMHLLKMESTSRIDPGKFNRPVKLNRKDPHRVQSDGALAPRRRMMLDERGDPILDKDGNPVYMSEDTNVPQADLALVAPDGGGHRRPGSSFKNKRTREVFQSSDPLRKSERYPWRLEDSSGLERWEGRLDGRVCIQLVSQCFALKVGLSSAR